MQIYTSIFVRLVILQKRVVKIIAKSPFDAHTDPIFKNLGILKFHAIHLLQIEGLFMYSLQILPSKFALKFTLNRHFHSNYTRNSQAFCLPFCRTNIKQFSVSTKDLNFTTLSILISSIRPLQLPLTQCLKKLLRHLFVIAIGRNFILSYTFASNYSCISFCNFCCCCCSCCCCCCYWWWWWWWCFFHILINCIFVKLAIRRHTLNFFFQL